VCEAAQLAPVRICALRELEHHVQHSGPGQAAFGAFGPVTDGGEGALYRVGNRYEDLGANVRL